MAWNLDIDPKMLEEQTESADNYSGGTEPGIYDVMIKEAYIKKSSSSDSEATQYVFETTDGKEIYFTDFLKNMVKDSKGKSYWESNGKSGAYNGVINLNRLGKVLDIDISKLKTKKVTIELFNEKVDVLLLEDFIGKKLKIAVQKFENEYDDNVTEKTNIIGFMDLEGNYKGKNIVEKLQKRIEKTPVVRLKEKASGSNTSKPKEEKEKLKGW